MQKKQKKRKKSCAKKTLSALLFSPFPQSLVLPLFSISVLAFRTMGRGLSQRRRVANVLKARQVSGIASTKKKESIY